MFTSLCSTKYLHACLNPSAKHWNISLMISTCSVPLALTVFKPTLRIRSTLKDVLKSIDLPRDSGAWDLGVIHLPGSQPPSVKQQWFSHDCYHAGQSHVAKGCAEWGGSETCIWWLDGWGETLLAIEEEMEAKALLRCSWHLSQERYLKGSAVNQKLLQPKARLRSISGYQNTLSQAGMILCLEAVRKHPSHR